MLRPPRQRTWRVRRSVFRRRTNPSSCARGASVLRRRRRRKGAKDLRLRMRRRFSDLPGALGDLVSGRFGVFAGEPLQYRTNTDDIWKVFSSLCKPKGGTIDGISARVWWIRRKAKGNGQGGLRRLPERVRSTF